MQKRHEKKFTIIGSGLMGMALAWKLKEFFPKNCIEVIESQAFPDASSVASGLIHGFHGPKAKRAQWMSKALDIFQDHLHSLKLHLGTDLLPFVQAIELVRPAWREEQYAHFTKRCAQFPDELEFIAKERMDPLIYPSPLILPFALKIKRAWLITTYEYLRAMRENLKNRGVIFSVQTVDPSHKSDEDEIRFVCCGYNSYECLPEKFKDSFTLTKGQILQWKKRLDEHDMSQIPQAVNSRYYLLKWLKGSYAHYLCGATFEHDHINFKPVQSPAFNSLENYARYWMGKSESSQAQVRVGLRANTHQRLPIVGWINPHLWIGCALGSKGLLYHTLIAQEVCQQLASYEIMTLAQKFKVDFFYGPQS